MISRSYIISLGPTYPPSPLIIPIWTLTQNGTVLQKNHVTHNQI